MSRSSMHELRRGVVLLHSEGLSAWTYLEEWRGLSKFLAQRESIYNCCPMHWQLTAYALYSRAIISLSALLQSGGGRGLSVGWLLNGVHENRRRDWGPISGIGKTDNRRTLLEQWVREDKDSLQRLGQECEPAIIHREEGLAHLGRSQLCYSQFIEATRVDTVALRLALFELSVIVNRWSMLLIGQSALWFSEGLSGLDLLGDLLERGLDARNDLLGHLEDPVSVEDAREAMSALNRDWQSQGRIGPCPDHLQDPGMDYLDLYTAHFSSWPQACGEVRSEYSPFAREVE